MSIPPSPRSADSRALGEMRDERILAKQLAVLAHPPEPHQPCELPACVALRKLVDLSIGDMEAAADLRARTEKAEARARNQALALDAVDRSWREQFEESASTRAERAVARLQFLLDESGSLVLDRPLLLRCLYEPKENP